MITRFLTASGPIRPGFSNRESDMVITASRCRPLVVPEAACDADGFAGDVSCLVGAEKRDRIRDVLRRTRPAQGNGPGAALGGFQPFRAAVDLRLLTHPGTDDEAGRDG